MTYAKFPPTGSGGGGGSGDIEGVTAGTGLSGGGTSGTVTVALATVTADRALVSNGSGYPAAATTTATEIGYVNGVTSAIQTQLDAKTTASSTTTFTNKTFDADGSGNSITNIENADIKAAAAIALNKLAATTASRALVSDGSGFVSAATTTATEIGYVNGVTSAIQTQINGKLSTSSLGTGVETFLGTPSSANLASAVTGETGSGALVFGTSPTFTTSALISATGELRFGDTDDSNYVGFKAPGTVGANKIWTLPSADGTNGQVLSTNGSAVLSWATASGGSSYTITAKTSDYSVLTGDKYTGFTNSGAGGTVIFTLPSASSGEWFEFYVQTAQTLQILCPASHTLTLDGVATATAGNIQTNVVGSYVRVTATGSNTYIGTNAGGDWQIN